MRVCSRLTTSMPGQTMRSSRSSRSAWEDLDQELGRDVEQALKRAASARRPQHWAPALRRLVDIFRERLVAAEKIDFFGSAGRDRVLTALRQLEDRIGVLEDSRRLLNRRITPDGRRRFRIACGSRGLALASIAWRLLGSFVCSSIVRPDSASQLIGSLVPDYGVPFDMFGVEFSHQGDGWNFEHCALSSASLDRRS